MFKDLDTQEIVQFIQLGGKVGEMFLNIFVFLNIKKIVIPYSFYVIQANYDPSKGLEEYPKSLVSEQEQTCLGLIKCYFENKILLDEQNFG